MCLVFTRKYGNEENVEFVDLVKSFLFPWFFFSISFSNRIPIPTHIWFAKMGVDTVENELKNAFFGKNALSTFQAKSRNFARKIY